MVKWACYADAIIQSTQFRREARSSQPATKLAVNACVLGCLKDRRVEIHSKLLTARVQVHSKLLISCGLSHINHDRLDSVGAGTQPMDTLVCRAYRGALDFHV